MEFFKNLEKALTEQITTLKPAPMESVGTAEYKLITLDYSEKDNAKWLELICEALRCAKTFEIHCWNEETEWIDLALQYGKLKDTDWQYGKIISGDVTQAFVRMIRTQPKPADTELENKMTPFFNIFLDDKFQSCHYGTEMYV